MTLLFDENLSPHLIGALSDLWPEAAHVHTAGLGNSSDQLVWQFAKANHLAIVTKDADFRDQVVIEGFPPKVIWLRVGNCTTAAAAAVLREANEVIDGFLADPDLGVLELR